METELNRTTPHKSGSVWKKFISQTIRIVIAAVILYCIISLVQWQNVILAYKSSDGFFIVIAALLVFVNIGVRTLKWHTMLYSVKELPTVYEAFGSVMLGISLASFTPGEIGEFAGRAVHITDAKRSHLVGLALFDKAQVFIVTSCAGLVSVACFAFHNNFILAIVTVIVVSFSGICIMRLNRVANLGIRLNASFFRKPWLTSVLDGFNLLTSQQILTTVLDTIVFHGIVILQMFCLLNAFSHISLLHAFIGTSALMFAKSLLPISIGDLGIREAGSIYFFSFYNISQAAALNASLILFVINIFIPSIIGIYFLRYQSMSVLNILQFWKKTKQESND